MPSSGKDAKRLSNLPAANGTNNVYFIKQSTYNKLRDSINFISTGGTGNPSKKKLGKRPLGTADGTIAAFTAVEIIDAVVDPHESDENAAEYAYVHSFNIQPTTEESINEKAVAILQRGALDQAPSPIVLSGVSSAYLKVNDVGHGYAKTTNVAGQLETTNEKTVIRVLDAKEEGENKLCKVLLGGGQANPVMRPVDLEKVGGTQGTRDTEPSWRYDVYLAEERLDEDREAILTDIDPTDSPHQWVRHLGQMTIADFGIAWLNTDNEWEVTWINEQLIAAECVPVLDPEGNAITLLDLEERIEALEAAGGD